MTGRVLIIGNKSKEAKLLHKAVKEGTHFVSRLISREEISLENIMKFKPDLAILSSEEGFDSMRQAHHTLKREAMTRELPVVAILEEGELGASGLPSDLSDVFCRPLRMAECISRILMLYRRSNRISDSSLIRSGDLNMDVSKYEVRMNGRKIDLTYTEYELLKFLMTHPEQVFNRDVLLNKVWGYEYYGGARTVDVHIRRLRSKIELKSQRFIETVRNIGYKFISQEEDEG